MVELRRTVENHSFGVQVIVLGIDIEKRESDLSCLLPTITVFTRELRSKPKNIHGELKLFCYRGWTNLTDHGQKWETR